MTGFWVGVGLAWPFCVLIGEVVVFYHGWTRIYTDKLEGGVL